jgi:hypothetical protein
VEREWLTTLASIDEDEVTYLDFVEEGTRLAQQLRVRAWGRLRGRRWGWMDGWVGRKGVWVG